MEKEAFADGRKKEFDDRKKLEIAVLLACKEVPEVSPKMVAEEKYCDWAKSSETYRRTMKNYGIDRYPSHL